MFIMRLIPYTGGSAAPLRISSEVPRFTWRWRSSSADNPDLVGVRQFQIRQTKPPILFGVDKLFLTIFCLEASWLRRFWAEQVLYIFFRFLLTWKELWKRFGSIQIYYT
jgi:hypothetical protein